MFSRKRIETEDHKMADASDDLGIPMKPVRPTAPGPNGPTKVPTVAPRGPEVVRAGDAIRPPEPFRRPGDMATQSRRIDGEVRKLTVGREITLSGEITSCDKLITACRLQPKLNNSAHGRIA